MVYVMSDIHGRYDLFIDMIDMIQLGDNDRLYILGNVIDRGPDPIKCLQYIMQHDNITLLVDDWRLINTIVQLISDGYITTAIRDAVYDYGGDTMIEQLSILDNDAQIAVLRFLRAQKEYAHINVSGKKYLLIHIANYSVAEADEIIISGQTPTNIMADTLASKCVKYDGYGYGYEITKGILLAQIARGCNRQIMYLPRRICIDCAAIFGGNLACIRLDDMAEYYVSGKSGKSGEKIKINEGITMDNIPPIGAIPDYVVARKRIKSLSQAISRYAMSPGQNTEIMKQWAAEIIAQCELIEKLKK